jgi:hypothetical protein
MKLEACGTFKDYIRYRWYEIIQETMQIANAKQTFQKIINF